MGNRLTNLFARASWDWLSRFGKRGAALPLAELRELTAAADRARPARGSLTLVQQMLEQGRVAILLRPQIAENLTAADLETAQSRLDEEMAIVPQGIVGVRPRCYDSLDDDARARAERLVETEGYFLDRYAVSNERYQEFVKDGGYEQMSLWDESIWPAVLSFVDRTGQPGPRFWEQGACVRGKETHPVVGISWYEASAFARWAGKRLPSDAEWVKAGAWPVTTDSARPVQRRFPWGEALDRRRANISGSGFETTVAVDALAGGDSVSNVHQLIGNVWEWTSGNFGTWEPAGQRIETMMPLRSIRGGAFDTYFEAQAHCQFQSGESPLARKHNIGFRCALGFCDVTLNAEVDGADEADEAHAREEALV
jgi:gamma-glutamyl hercynylcysteine S-oxide synthase